MEELRAILGETLFCRVSDRLGTQRLILDDGKLIPKHRFDCINISLKEHKERVEVLQSKNAQLENEVERLRHIEARCRTLERENLILNELSKSKAKNFKSVKALLQLDGFEEFELAENLAKQLKQLKKTDAYLFGDGNEVFMLVPYTKNRKLE